MQEINISDSAKRWIDRRLSPSIHPCSIGDLQKQVEDTPEFWTNDIDESYRQGFEEGFDYCITQFEEMYRKKGFVRVREIANILWQWSDLVLRRWKVYGKGRHRDYGNHHPVFRQHETWSDIRNRILRRDKMCVRCGDVLKLEVDHIIDVQHGGLPVDSNLRTLCKVCHKTKPVWHR